MALCAVGNRYKLCAIEVMLMNAVLYVVCVCDMDRYREEVSVCSDRKAVVMPETQTRYERKPWTRELQLTQQSVIALPLL